MLKELMRYTQKIFDVKYFGFETPYEFVDSMFHITLLKTILPISAFLTAFALLFEEYLGMKPIVYLSFAGLFVLEFYTGIRASKKRGEAIVSYKLPGAATKAAFYTIILGMLNIFGRNTDEVNLILFQLNIYEFVYYFVFNIIVLSLLVSVFENTRDLGYKESSRIFKMLSVVMEKVLNVQESDLKSNKNHNWERKKIDDGDTQQKDY